ncbi:MAG: DNA polymerase III subunit delta' [Deltaproteobacteria bacterium]|jgi:DNA polymerase-3 subunit delta'|nr:DNA polymerase III subunit delta' [Deltaproteobacteria bacterium]
MDPPELCFKHILGHEKAKHLLLEAAAKNKIGHAYLFRGPDGVGKKRTALALAAYLNCKSPLEKDACCTCGSCRKYNSGSHPDFIHIIPDGAAIKIGQVRELKHQLSFAPLEAAVRVIILEDVHTMKREAANSLLKTLEEPAENNLLILTADQAGEILPTIISRCQIIPFGPLDYKDMARVLMREKGIDNPKALTVAAAAEGSLGRAMLLLEKDLLALRQEVVEHLLLLQNDRPDTIAEVFRLSEKAAALKENIYEFLALLRLWYRDLVLVSAGQPDSSAACQDLMASLPAAIKRWNIAQLNERIGRLDLAEKQLLRNCSRSLVLESLFFDLI